MRRGSSSRRAGMPIADRSFTQNGFMNNDDRDGLKRGYLQSKQGFRPLRGRVTFFFRGEKESNQRKAPFPTEQT
jgi:hypothetical protein